MGWGARLLGSLWGMTKKGRVLPPGPNVSPP